MTMPQTETTNMRAWQEPEWKIAQLNVPVLVVLPPAAFTSFEEPPSLESVGGFEIAEPGDQSSEDSEDLQDALATEFRYQTRGVEGFIPYRDYRRQKSCGEQ